MPVNHIFQIHRKNWREKICKLNFSYRPLCVNSKEICLYERDPNAPSTCSEPMQRSAYRMLLSPKENNNRRRQCISFRLEITSHSFSKTWLSPFIVSVCVFFSSFTLLCFVRQVATQMRRNVSYTHTYDLCMIYISSITLFLNFWQIYFPSKITYVTSSFTLTSNVNFKRAFISRIFMQEMVKRYDRIIHLCTPNWIDESQKCGCS